MQYRPPRASEIRLKRPARRPARRIAHIRVPGAADRRPRRVSTDDNPMQFLIGLVMFMTGVMLVYYGRPSIGGRIAAFIARPSISTSAALVVTALISLGVAFMVAGLV
jgi:hypothetical protein